MSEAHKSDTLANDQNLNAFVVGQLRPQTLTDFDLYIKLQDKYVLYSSNPYIWKGEEILRLHQEGHGALYYFTADQKKVDIYLKLCELKEVSKETDPRKRLLDITDLGASLTRIIYENPLTKSTLSVAEEVANAMVETVREDPACVNALGKLAHHDYYTYYHSARVAAYAISLAMQMSENDERRLQELALGCVLHDIGKSKIDLSILNKPAKLDAAEWELMRKHPVYGDQMAAETEVPVIPKNIILHHHERMDGQGYPHNLSKNEILMEVRIAAFADVFDALTTNRAYQASRTRFEAMDLIRFKLLDAIDAEVYKAMVEILQKGKPEENT